MSELAIVAIVALGLGFVTLVIRGGKGSLSVKGSDVKFQAEIDTGEEIKKPLSD